MACNLYVNMAIVIVELVKGVVFVAVTLTEWQCVLQESSNRFQLRVIYMFAFISF